MKTGRDFVILFCIILHSLTMALAAIQAVAQIISAVIPVLSCVKEAADKAESVPDFISKIENAKLPQDLTPMQAKFLTE